MTDTQEQWLLCLSASSLLGPKCDIDALNKKGYYKKMDPQKGRLDLNIDPGNALYKDNEPLIQAFLAVYQVKDRESYYQVIDKLIEGSDFAINMNRLMQVGKAMDQVDREKKVTFMMNGRPYMYENFQTLMGYEFHWPKYGLRSYDYANALMLVRLGESLGYGEEGLQLTYLQKILEKLELVYKSPKDFGESTEIGRQLHCKYLSSMGIGKGITEEKEVFSMVYYALWKNMGQYWPENQH